jgi:transcriptional regulator with XRE-family HTH domain
MNASTGNDVAQHRAVLESLGRNLATARKAAGWTQSELAIKAGIARSSIGKIESYNATEVSLSSLAALATAFELPPYLFLLASSDWERLAVITSMKEMVAEGRSRNAAIEPDVERLELLASSDIQSEQNTAAQEIGHVVDQLLGHDTVPGSSQARPTWTTVSAAMGTSMLPGLPVVNGLIARILANSTKRL